MKAMDIEKYAKATPQYYTEYIPPLLQKYLTAGDYNTILDAGAGDGSLLYALSISGYLENKEVYAVDLSRNRIRLIKEYHKQIIANVDNVEDLATIKDNSIDFLISTQVIEHVNDRKMIGSIGRVVKKEGIIYLSTVFKKPYAWYFYKHNEKWVLDPTHLREYQDDQELLSLIPTDEFEILENCKALQWFPIVDFFIKRSKIRNRKLFSKGIFTLARMLKIPIPGYYIWEIVLKKR
jgi:2-polyprenyl-3-methyl-5-hydroxy-6-metoxy-1,4-benzoquinol methylase